MPLARNVLTGPEALRAEYENMFSCARAKAWHTQWTLWTCTALRGTCIGLYGFALPLRAHVSRPWPGPCAVPDPFCPWPRSSPCPVPNPRPFPDPALVPAVAPTGPGPDPSPLQPTNPAPKHPYFLFGPLIFFRDSYFFFGPLIFFRAFGPAVAERRKRIRAWDADGLPRGHLSYFFFGPLASKV